MNGKQVNFDELKYDLNELFENTPVFREPLMMF